MKLKREEYIELYKKLPKDIFDFVYSENTTKKLYELAQKHHLHIDEAGILHDIIMDTAMGIIATKNLQSEIVRELKLNPLDASRIVQEVDTEIFAPIKQIMVETYKHSNPFKPQTLQHVDEEDELDETHLDRNHLLNEIENPPESFKKKEVLKDEVKEVVSQEKAEVVTPIVQDDPIKKLGSKILESLEAHGDLPKVVTMQAFMPKESETSTTARETTVSSVPAEQVPTPLTKTEPKPVEQVIETSIPQKEIPVVTPISEVLPTKPDRPTNVSSDSKTAVVTETKTEITSPSKTFDPYREPIE